jgi:hypothetical protein
MKHPIRVQREYVERIEYSDHSDYYGDYNIVKKAIDRIQYRNEKGKWVDAPVYNKTRKRYEKNN